MPEPLYINLIAIGQCANLAEPGVWKLFLRPRQSSDGEWQNILLVRPPEAAKKGEHRKARKYWVGWNGSRFATTTDSKVFQRKHPHAWKWLNEQIRAQPAASFFT